MIRSDSAAVSHFLEHALPATDELRIAVVAIKVRNLASRVTGAAEEIKILIEDRIGKVDDDSCVSDKSGSALEIIVTSVREVTALIPEIASTCRERASAADEVNKAVMEMDEVAQPNAALVEQATAVILALSDETNSPAQLVACFEPGGSPKH